MDPVPPDRQAPGVAGESRGAPRRSRYLLLGLGILPGLALAAAPAPAASQTHPLRIAVIGGGGQIGQRVVREALARGHRVTLVARDPARVADSHPALAVVRGDALDGAGLVPVLAGHDVVVSAVGAARAAAPDYTLYRRVAESLVGALRRLAPRAPRLIVVGGVGTLLDRSGRLLLERAPADRQGEHRGQQAALEFYRTVTDLPWTYLSPPARIAPGDRTGRYRLGTDTLLVTAEGASAISMEDYAVALVDEAETPRHTGRRFTVGY